MIRRLIAKLRMAPPAPSIEARRAALVSRLKSTRKYSEERAWLNVEIRHLTNEALREAAGTSAQYRGAR